MKQIEIRTPGSERARSVFYQHCPLMTFSGAAWFCAINKCYCPFDGERDPPEDCPLPLEISAVANIDTNQPSPEDSGKIRYEVTESYSDTEPEETQTDKTCDNC